MAEQTFGADGMPVAASARLMVESVVNSTTVMMSDFANAKTRRSRVCEASEATMSWLGREVTMIGR